MSAKATRTCMHQEPPALRRSCRMSFVMPLHEHAAGRATVGYGAGVIAGVGVQGTIRHLVSSSMVGGVVRSMPVIRGKGGWAYQSAALKGC
jgi:hypothetical protein